jgi:hypothetical protein
LAFRAGVKKIFSSELANMVYGAVIAQFVSEVWNEVKSSSIPSLVKSNILLIMQRFLPFFITFIGMFIFFRVKRHFNKKITTNKDEIIKIEVVVGTIIHNKKEYEPGQIFDIDKAEAERLVDTLKVAKRI